MAKRNSTKHQTHSDFYLADHGSLWVLTPLTPAGKAWIEEHIPDDALTWGKNGIVIEPRYVEDIVGGFVADGLSYA